MLLGVAVLLVAACAAATHHSEGAAVQYQDPARLKRNPLGFNARGFHDDIFGQEFGVFHTVKRSRSVDSMERPLLVGVAENSAKNGRYKREMPSTTKAMEYSKRRPEMGSSGFHGDTFSSGFGEFWTMKKKGLVKRDPEVPEPLSYTDIWSDKEMEKKSGTNEEFTSEIIPARFREENVLFEPHMSEGGASRHLLKNKGDWHRIMSASLPVKPYLRGNEDAVVDMLRSRMGSVQTDSGLRDAAEQTNPVYETSPHGGETVMHQKAFPKDLADLWRTNGNSQHENAHKRRPEMGSSGFHGNMFSNGFGEFWPMKKKSNSLVMYGDADVDKLQPMKRRPEMDSLGFHGDTFHNGFGDFWPMKRSIQAENFAGGQSDLKAAQNYSHSKECCIDDNKTDVKISVR